MPMDSILLDHAAPKIFYFTLDVGASSVTSFIGNLDVNCLSDLSDGIPVLT